MNIRTLGLLAQAVRRGSLVLTPVDLTKQSPEWEMADALASFRGADKTDGSWWDGSLSPGLSLTVNDFARNLVKKAEAVLSSGLIEHLVSDEQRQADVAAFAKTPLAMFLTSGCKQTQESKALTDTKLQAPDNQR